MSVAAMASVSEEITPAERDAQFNVTDCADKFKILADPTRLKVIAALDNGPMSVTALLKEIPIAQNLLSHHLKVLREGGLVVGTRAGKSILYRRNEDVFVPGADKMDFGCCSVNLHHTED